MSCFTNLIFANALFQLSRALIGGFIIAQLLNDGIDLSTISLAKAIQLTSAVLLTVPIGRFSDLYGQKICVIIGCFFAILYFICLLRPTNMSVLLGEFFNGVSLACYCGAYEAWVFSFSKPGKQEGGQHLFAKSQELSYVIMVASGFFGAILSQYALYCSILVMPIAIACFFFTVEAPISDDRRSYSVLHCIEACFLNNKYRLMYGISLILCMSFGQTIFQFWQPFFIENNLDISNGVLGGIFSLFIGGQFLFSIISRKYLFDRMQYSHFIYSLFSGLILLFISVASARILFIDIVCFVFFMAISTVSVNLMFSQFIGQAKKSYHATAISVIDASARLLGACILWIFSLMDTQNITVVWSILGCIFLLTSWVILLDLRPHAILQKNNKYQ